MASYLKEMNVVDGERGGVGRSGGDIEGVVVGGSRELLGAQRLMGRGRKISHVIYSRSLCFFFSILYFF